METKTCLDCGKEKLIAKFPRQAKRKDGPKSTARQNRCQACLGRKRRAYDRLGFFDAYGGRCACCGEDDYRFLTLDHVNGDGCKHRLQYKNHQIYLLARREGYPDKYRVLCFNCNSGSGVNSGVCPHKDPIGKDQAWAELRSSVSYIGRGHVIIPDEVKFKKGFDPRRTSVRSLTTGRFEKLNEAQA